VYGGLTCFWYRISFNHPVTPHVRPRHQVWPAMTMKEVKQLTGATGSFSLDHLLDALGSPHLKVSRQAGCDGDPHLWRLAARGVLVHLPGCSCRVGQYSVPAGWATDAVHIFASNI
jgi:hypothetical protein